MSWGTAYWEVCTKHRIKGAPDVYDKGTLIFLIMYRSKMINKNFLHKIVWTGQSFACHDKVLLSILKKARSTRVQALVTELQPTNMEMT
jgi:hypothetical protein